MNSHQQPCLSCSSNCYHISYSEIYKSTEDQLLNVKLRECFLLAQKNRIGLSNSVCYCGEKSIPFSETIEDFGHRQEIPLLVIRKEWIKLTLLTPNIRKNRISERTWYKILCICLVVNQLCNAPYSCSPARGWSKAGSKAWELPC